MQVQERRLFNYGEWRRKQSLWKRVGLGVLAIALATAYVLVVTQPSDAQPPQPQPTEQVQPEAEKAIPPILVDPKIWGSRMSGNWHDGEFGHSGSRTKFPKNVARKLAGFAARMADQGIRVKKWWKKGDGLSRQECIFHGLYYPGPVLVDIPLCLKYGDRPTVRRITRKMTKIVVVCGGAAAIGSLGGAPIAIGSGVGACTFTEYADRAVRMLP